MTRHSVHVTDVQNKPVAYLQFVNDIRWPIPILHQMLINDFATGQEPIHY
jgi:hypothetical protein